MTEPKRRPKVLAGHTHRVVTGCGNLYVTVNSDDQGPFEVFAHLGKSGQCGSAQIEAICRLISVGLRAEVDVKAMIKQLTGIRCPSMLLSEGEEILSCADGIACALAKESGVERKKDILKDEHGLEKIN